MFRVYIYIYCSTAMSYGAIASTAANIGQRRARPCLRTLSVLGQWPPVSAVPRLVAAAVAGAPLQPLAFRCVSSSARSGAGARKAAVGVIDESGEDSEEAAVARARYSVDGNGDAGTRRLPRGGGSVAVDNGDGDADFGAATRPAEVTSLGANPYDYPVLQPKAAPLWMLYEAQREERPLVEAGRGLREKLRDNPTELRIPMRDSQGRAYATGRRKEAVARVWVSAGAGKFIVNGCELADYFTRMADRQHAIEPLIVTQTCGAVDVVLTCKSGGMHGQAGAVRHGLANALARFDPYLKPALRRFKLIQRDSRMVERKKPGQKKARKKFQWIKR